MALGISPMANTVMMFDCLSYAPDHPDYATPSAAPKLLSEDGDRLLPALSVAGLGYDAGLPR